MEYVQSSLFGKMLQEPSHQIMGVTFKPCSAKSHRPIFQCLEVEDGQKPEWLEVKEWGAHGECSTPSIGESPSTVRESSLSQVLESGGGAVEVLFKPESVRRDSEKGEGKREETPRITGSCSEKASTRMETKFFPTKSYTVIGQGLPASTLKAAGGEYGGGSENYTLETNKAPQAILKPSGYVVRRLTPLECERLQGLPDNYTAYGSDTARYKAIGNGMAQPCADFVLSKVVEMFEEADDET